MVLGEVVGQVVCTVKEQSLAGIKLMLVQLLNEDGTPRGRPQVAADVIGDAGVGDMVFLVGKKEAAIPLKELAPVDLGIVGFVDELTCPGAPRAGS